MIIESTAGLVIGGLSLVLLGASLYLQGLTKGRRESRDFIRALEGEINRARPYIGQEGTTFTVRSNPSTRRIYSRIS